MSEHRHTDLVAASRPVSFMAMAGMPGSPSWWRLQPAANRATGTRSSLWHEASRRWLNSSFKENSQAR